MVSMIAGALTGFQTWYLAFCLQAVVLTGLVPILMPLLVNRAGIATHIGLVMASFVAGGLTAPVWGLLGDRFLIHRELLAGGMLVAGVGLALFVVGSQPLLWMGLAFLVSTAAAASATTANLFIVEQFAEERWELQFGSLQTFYGLGWVLGLLLAAVFSRNSLTAGFLVAALLMVLAALIAWHSTRRIELVRRPPSAVPSRGGDFIVGDPQRHYHFLSLGELRNLRPLHTGLGLFLLAWALSIAGAGMIFSVYPVLMRDQFGVSPTISSLIYAAAVAAGIFFYALAGRLSVRYGPPRVFELGLLLRFIPFLILAVMVMTVSSYEDVVAIGAVLVVVIAWSFLSVCGSALAARLHEGSQGATMGLFNFVTALGGMIGSLLGGWLTQHAHEGASTVGAALALGVSLMLAFLLARRTDVAMRAGPGKHQAG